MHKPLFMVLGIVAAVAPAYAAQPPSDAFDEEINAWTECTIDSTIALADQSKADEAVPALVMQDCARHGSQLKAAAKAKHPALKDHQIHSLVEAVRRSQEQSVPIILTETRAARAKKRR